MKSTILATALMLSLNANARVEAPPPTIVCSGPSAPTTVIASIQNGTITVIDNINIRALVQVDRLRVVKNGNQYSFENLGDHTDLPSLVFTATFNAQGFGSGTSFDDTAGGRSDFKCMLN